jgi:hypothetical protein
MKESEKNCTQTRLEFQDGNHHVTLAMRGSTHGSRHRRVLLNSLALLLIDIWHVEDMQGSDCRKGQGSFPTIWRTRLAVVLLFRGLISQE